MVDKTKLKNNTIFNNAYLAYAKTMSVEKALTNAGLFVEGDIVDGDSVCNLYGIQTNTVSIMLEVLGVPDILNFFEEFEIMLHEIVKTSKCYHEVPDTLYDEVEMYLKTVVNDKP